MLEHGVGESERALGSNLETGEQQEPSEEPGSAPRIAPGGRLLAFSARDAGGGPNRVVVRELIKGSRDVADGACPSFTDDGELLVRVPIGSIEIVSLDGISAGSIGAVDEGTCAVHRP